MSKRRLPPNGSAPAPPRRARLRSHPGDGSLLQDPVLSAALLQAIPDLIFVIGRDGTYLDYYARDLSDLLMPPDQFLGKKMRDIMPPHLTHRFMNAIRRAGPRTGAIVVEYDLMLPHRRFYQARIVSVDRKRVLSTVRE